MTPHSVDNASITGTQSFIQRYWAERFQDRIYQICGNVHPGMAIECEAVYHIKDLITQIVTELLDSKPANVLELNQAATKLFPPQCGHMVNEAWDAMHQHTGTTRKLNAKTPAAKLSYDLNHRMISLIRESIGCKEKEKRDREREKEVERMSIYIMTICEHLTEDILKWTGRYVKNIRSCEQKICLQNLKIALSADRALLMITSALNNEEEDSHAGGFLSNFFDYELDDDDVNANVDKKDMTYDSIASDFLKDERLYLRELKQVNVFRRRLESNLNDEDRVYVGLLFGNLNEILELTMKMERTLEDSIEMSNAPCIGMGLWELAEACEFDGYLSYVLRGRDDEPERPLTIVIQETIDEILASKRCAAMFDQRCVLDSLDGQSFRLAVKYMLPTMLHAPILHMARYVDYVTKLLRYTNSDEDQAELQNCRSYLSNVVSRLEHICGAVPQLTALMSEQVQRSTCDSKISQACRLQEIQRGIDGFLGNPIGKTCTDLVKEGPIQIVRASSTFSQEIIRKGRWTTDRYLYLFDQLLVMCKRHKTQKFKDRISVHLMDIRDIDDTDDQKYAFQIDVREKSGETRSYTFICASAEEKNSWMSALVRVNCTSVLDRALDRYEKEEAKKIPLVVPSVEQYRFAEGDTEENITFEDYTSSSGIPVVKSGTVLKLVERLTFHQYTDNKFVQTFLISYRSFCSPTELLDMLMERFNVPIPSKLQNESRGGPLAGRYDTVQSHGLSGTTMFSAFNEQSYQRFRKEYERPIQRRVLSVLHQWVKNHWYDFEYDTTLLDVLEKFLVKSCETPGKLTNQHKKFCRFVIVMIEKKRNLQNGGNGPLSASAASGQGDGHVNVAFDWDGVSLADVEMSVNTFQPKKPETVWHTAKKGDISSYDLLTLHPLEIGRQLTLLHFDLYRAIKPIELVGAAWTKHDKHKRSPQLLKLTTHSTLLSYWVSRTIVETDSLDERVAIFSRVLEIMSVFEELHNFTGLVAFVSALNSSFVHRLTMCWERLDNEKQQCFDRFNNLCESRWHEMQKRLQSINPPCVPFFGHYLTNIFFFETGNSTFVNQTAAMKEPRMDSVDPQSPTSSHSRLKVSFMKCRRISEIIREIQMYQNQPYPLLVEPSVRQFFESINPRSDFNDDNEALESYLWERSNKVQPKEMDKYQDQKPKRGANVLKSPGIKPPKVQSNHYTSGHQAHHSTSSSSGGTPVFGHHSGGTPVATVPSTPCLDGDGPRSSALLTPPSDNDFATMTEVAQHRFKQPPTKFAPQLQPPPLHPRRAQRPPAPMPVVAPSTTTPPPPLFPRKMTSSPVQQMGSMTASRSPKTPGTPRTPGGPRTPGTATTSAGESTPSPSAFVFPNVDVPSTVAPAPALPPRRVAAPPLCRVEAAALKQQEAAAAAASAAAATTAASSGKDNGQLQVVFDRTTSSPDSSHSPTVCLSVPLPPALPPRRGTSVPQRPPPLPPKTNRPSGSSTSSSPQTASPAPLTLPTSSASPPPLPPKTYNRQKMSPPAAR